MLDDDGQLTMTPDMRVRAVAAILAGGILRLHHRRPLSSESDEIPDIRDSPQSDQNCLELSKETVLSVHTG
jgi:hypothetical protein